MKELRETIHNANLTKTQKMIAKYILDNSADACFMTSTEIALKLGVLKIVIVALTFSGIQRLYGLPESSAQRLPGQSPKYLQQHHRSLPAHCQTGKIRR